MRMMIGLAVFVAVLILGFIVWATGGSPAAFFAGILLLACVSIWGVGVAGIATIPSAARMILGWAVTLCLIVIVWVGVIHWREILEAKTPTATTAQQSPPVVIQLPTKIRAETPATITADYGFSLETDGPIMVQYPGEEPFLLTPEGDDCQQLPQPRRSGPKKFWDPEDPEEGHISFRIYRGRGECEIGP